MSRLPRRRNYAKRSKKPKCLKKPKSRLNTSWNDYHVCRQPPRSTGSSARILTGWFPCRSEGHTSELQSRLPPVFRAVFFNDTATTEIYTLSLHDALPISGTIITFADSRRGVRGHPHVS